MLKKATQKGFFIVSFGHSSEQKSFMIKYVHAYAGRDATLERKASYIRENSKGGVTIEGNFFSFHVSVQIQFLVITNVIW